jgi:tetratricopeptide (TPR) repeat protein
MTSTVSFERASEMSLSSLKRTPMYADTLSKMKEKELQDQRERDGDRLDVLAELDQAIKYDVVELMEDELSDDEDEQAGDALVEEQELRPPLENSQGAQVVQKRRTIKGRKRRIRTYGLPRDTVQKIREKAADRIRALVESSDQKILDKAKLRHNPFAKFQRPMSPPRTASSYASAVYSRQSVRSRHSQFHSREGTTTAFSTGDESTTGSVFDTRHVEVPSSAGTAEGLQSLMELHDDIHTSSSFRLHSAHDVSLREETPVQDKRMERVSANDSNNGPLRLVRTDAFENPGRNIRDYLMLADACRRDGRLQLEALAYYQVGVLLDAEKKLEHAIEYYDRYRKYCVEKDDLEGLILALNHMGVNYQLLGDEEALQISIHCHTDMLDLGGDPFVAHCNLGHVYRKTGREAPSAYHFAQALEVAIHDQDFASENLLYCNLARVDREHGDFQNARNWIEKHLALSNSLNDEEAIALASEQLGILNVLEGDAKDAESLLNASMQVAKGKHDVNAIDACAVGIGLAKGGERMEEILREMGDRMVQTDSPPRI